MGRIGIQGHIRHHQHIRHSGLHRGHGAGVEIMGILGFAPPLIFQGGIHHRKQQHRPPTVLIKSARAFTYRSQRQTALVWQTVNGDIPIPIMHKIGLNQVAGVQTDLLHQIPHGGGGAQATKAGAGKTHSTPRTNARIFTGSLRPRTVSMPLDTSTAKGCVRSQTSLTVSGVNPPDKKKGTFTF